MSAARTARGQVDDSWLHPNVQASTGLLMRPVQVQLQDGCTQVGLLRSVDPVTGHILLLEQHAQPGRSHEFFATFIAAHSVASVHGT